ncbi:hypothetical protein BV22DRAFT_428402 [Leucogyrophana mollusca]|uniref:Uncharacterized protein n=1 Tax=Leucogyrophana mollusca TaxID=85980 RepID=A0ACB8BI62_9AGAM|nr:hypothetical protein BV22DRAFT_428402 [Leucogyrophana mollusca]
MLGRMPIDVVSRIFLQLDVIDLIRVQQVSKLCLEAIQERAVWSAAYRRSSSPRPPGPFSWQSTAYLRTNLVASEKVERNWPPCTTSQLSSRSITLSALDHHFGLILGRYLMVAGIENVHCYDLDSAEGSDHRMQHVYHTPRGSKIADFECVDVTAADGQFAFAICLEREDGPAAATVKISRIVIQEGMPVVFELVLKIVHAGPKLFGVQISPRALVGKGGSDDQDGYNKIWVMDIRTYRAYKLSPPQTSVRNYPGMERWSGIYTTHVC